MDRNRALALIARLQRGVFSHAQARGAGWTDAAIRWAVRTGRWEVWFDGVYGPAGLPRDPETELVAALLRVGGDAVVARRSAGRVWQLPGLEAWTVPELVVPRTHAPVVEGITCLTSRSLPEGDVISHGRRRVTTVTRTVHDLAAVLEHDALLAAAAEGYRLGRTDPRRLALSLIERRRFQGNARLREVLAVMDPNYAQAHSFGEVEWHTTLTALGYTGYRLNHRLRLRTGRRIMADLFFPPRGICEFMSKQWHGRLDQQRNDASRRADIEADGYAYAELWMHEREDHDRVRAVIDDLIARSVAAG